MENENAIRAFLIVGLVVLIMLAIACAWGGIVVNGELQATKAEVATFQEELGMMQTTAGENTEAVNELSTDFENWKTEVYEPEIKKLNDTALTADEREKLGDIDDIVGSVEQYGEDIEDLQGDVADNSDDIKDLDERVDELEYEVW